MALFEVYIPGKEAGMPNVTLTIDAPNWIGALRSGLKSIGEGGEAIANVMCDIKEDNSIHVTDVQTHRVFRLREVTPKPQPARPISMPDGRPEPEDTVKMARADFDEQSQPKTLIEFPMAQLPTIPSPSSSGPPAATAPWPSAPGPAPTVPPPSAARAPAPVTGARPIAPPTAADGSIPWSKMPAPAAPVKAQLPDAEASVPWTKMPSPSPVSAPEMTSPFAKSGPSPAAQQAQAPAPAPAPAKPAPLPSLAKPIAPVAQPAQPQPQPQPAPATPASDPTTIPDSSSATAKVRIPSSGGDPFSAPLSAGAPSPALSTSSLPPVAAPAAAAGSAPVEQTEKVVRQPSQKTPARPAAPPTPRGVGAPAPKRPSGQFSGAPEPRAREESRPHPTDPKIGRAVEKPSVDVQDAIAAVFDATQDLYMVSELSAQMVADKLLDIALAHIPAESGTFYLADVNAYELSFAAVRGPKADAIRRSGVTLKVGQGIIGFCAQEGICLAVSDIQKDPRFYTAIAKSIDYHPTDTLCATCEKDGRLWGALQLINSRNPTGAGFDAAHMEVLRFIGLTAAAVLERIDERR